MHDNLLRRIIAAQRLGLGFVFVSLLALGSYSLSASPPPVRQLEVDFQSGSIRLSATLWLPEGAGPHPALVTLHGSGRIGRGDFYGTGDRWEDPPPRRTIDGYFDFLENWLEQKVGLKIH